MTRFGGTVVCIGTGPTLTLAQIESARSKGFALVGCNNTHQIVPDLAVLYATNENFWTHYWHRHDGPRLHPCEKWTNNRVAAEKFGLNYIESRDRTGLSASWNLIHHGHGSGFSLVNLAFLMGATRIVLLGYDMKYAPDYDGRVRQIGATPRHYFGEYPSDLQHWPKVSVKNGIHIEMLDRYRQVREQGLVEILNCTPDSALECFPKVDINAL